MAPFLHNNLYIDWVEPISGWGVFTKEALPKNEIVETSPVVLYPEEIVKIAFWNAENQDHQIDPYVHLGLTLYSLNWNEGYVAVPLGWGAIYNHSDNNNCQFLIDQENGFLHILTLREIAANEQLLVSYGKDWFDTKPFPKIDL